MKAISFLLLASLLVAPAKEQPEPAPAQVPGDPSHLDSLSDTWSDLYLKMPHEDTTMNAFIVIDPREGAIWIEKDGKVDPRNVRILPHDREWSAFYVSDEGVAKIKFPVRVRRYRCSNIHPRPNEMVWVQGASKSGNWRWRFAAGTNNQNGMGWGTGDGGKSTMTFTIPELKPGRKPSIPEKSILQQSTPTPPQFAEHFPDQLFEVNVVRTPAK